MHDVTVAATDGGLVAVSVLTDFQGQLGRVDPCALRWKQLATLATTTVPAELAADPGLHGFADSGDEMVKHIISSFTDRVITRGTCGTQTSYTIDLLGEEGRSRRARRAQLQRHVDADDLAALDLLVTPLGNSTGSCPLAVTSLFD